MKHQITRLVPINVRALLTSCIAIAITASAGAGIVLQDDFNEYTGWNSGDLKMNANWTKSAGSGTPAVYTFADTTWHDSQYADANGAAINRSLEQTLSVDWTLSIDVAISSSSTGRFFWIGLLNAAGTEGYGFYWEAGATSTPQGVVRLNKYSVTGPSDLLWNMTGTSISGSAVASGHVKTATTASEGAFASFELTWEASLSRLTLFVDGVLKCQATDASFSSFSSVFMGGNGGVAIDDLTITAVPEPATCAIIFGSLALLVLGIHRKQASR
jgi:hypothetical protein